MVKISVEKYIERVPKKYVDFIRVIGGDCGGSSLVEYTNAICGCKTHTTIKAILARNQLDYCKKCHNVIKNKSNTSSLDKYLSKIPDEYRKNIKVLGQRTGSRTIISYKFPECNCTEEFELGHFSRRKQYLKCKKCVLKELRFPKDLQFHLKEKLGDRINNVEVIGDYKGLHSDILYAFPKCGCKINTKIYLLKNRNNIDVCEQCFNHLFLSKHEMLTSLSSSINNPVVTEGFPGNRSTIIQGFCKKCGAVVRDSYFNLQQYYCRNKNQCKKCAPKSVIQNEIFEYVKSLGVSVVQSDLNTIKFKQSDKRFKELDILCFDKKFAIEYNGLYYHSEKYKSDKNYHWNKTKAAAELGISLLHIWEDKWITSSDIYKSIIKVKLGLVDRKVYARKTNVKELSKDELREFFNKNHLDGHTGCITGWGLYQKDELVQAISVRRVNSQNKKYKGFLEIARSASVLNTVVVGGESKLLSTINNYAINNCFSGILNYVDADLGSTPSSRWCFNYSGVTTVSYFYIKEREPIRISRQKIQAKNGKSEKDLAKESGLLKVYANRNYVYELTFPFCRG